MKKNLVLPPLLALPLLVIATTAFTAVVRQNPHRRQLHPRQESSSQSNPCLLHVLRDEYLQPQYTDPSPPPTRHDVERMVECASSDGLCELEEIAEMIAEIDQANAPGTSGHGDGFSKERDDVLKQALSLQMELTETRQAIRDMGLPNDQAARPEDDDDDDTHSSPSSSADRQFARFVDYRSIGEFESH